MRSAHRLDYSSNFSLPTSLYHHGCSSLAPVVGKCPWLYDTVLGHNSSRVRCGLSSDLNEVWGVDIYFDFIFSIAINQESNTDVTGIKWMQNNCKSDVINIVCLLTTPFFLLFHISCLDCILLSWCYHGSCSRGV